MLAYVVPFIGLCVGILACHDPLMNWIDARLGEIANNKD
jgi:hypothetical protein